MIAINEYIETSSGSHKNKCMLSVIQQNQSWGEYVPPAMASPSASFVFIAGFSTICAWRPSLHLKGIGVALFEDLIK